jgi:hypothetical protein
MYLIKTDSLGNLQWSKTYGTTLDDMARGCVVASDGGYLLAGYTDEVGSLEEYDILILKADSLGNFEWARSFDHLEMDGSSFVDLTNDSGFIFTGGGINNFPYPLDLYVIKTDSMGLISNSCHQNPPIVEMTPPTQEASTTIYEDFPITGEAITINMQDVNPEIVSVCCSISSSGLADQVLCVGENINLSVTAGGTSPFAYQWTYEGIPIAGETNSTFIVLAADTTFSGVYSCIVSNDCGTSTNSAEVIVEVCALNVNLLSDTICEGECVDLFATTTSASGAVSYVWDNGITQVNAGPITVCPISSTTYVVIATDSTGLSDTTSATITVLPFPIVDLGNDTTLCSPPIVLDAQNSGSNFLWQDGSTSNTFSVINSGTYWLQVDNAGCTASDSIDVNFNGVFLDLGPDIATCNPLIFTTPFNFFDKIFNRFNFLKITNLTSSIFPPLQIPPVSITIPNIYIILNKICNVSITSEKP